MRSIVWTTSLVAALLCGASAALGVTVTIAVTGQAAPDANGVLSAFGSPALNDSGRAAFYASLTGTSGGGTDDTGIFRGSGGLVTQIAREGQAAPDANGTFYSFGTVVLNGPGQAAFYASLTGTSGGITDNSGVFRGSGGSVTQIAREGQAAPDGNGTLYAFSTPALNGSGQAAFRGTLTGTSGGGSDDTGIFRGSGGSVTQIAREGQAAPDGNGTFSGFSSPALNGSSQAAFYAGFANTSGGGSDDTGIFRGSGGSVTQIARKGQAAPDGNGTFYSVGTPALNDSGQAAFYANLTNTSGGTTDNTGIYIGDGVELVQVVREGQALAGSSIAILSLATGADDRSGVNDFGQVAYKADLANGDNVVAVFTPEVHWRTAGSGNWSTRSNWTLGIAPAAMYHVLIDPAGSLNVAGHYTNTTVKSLTVGSTGGGLATLNLTGGGDLAAVGTVTVTAAGQIQIGAGRVLSAAALVNGGLLTGEGVIQAPLANQAAGEVCISSGRQLLFAGGEHANAGKIEAIGGEIRFAGDLTNAASTGLIAGRNATLRFTGGLANNGSMALSFGTSDLSGEITNAATGRIVISGNSEATFYGDVANAGVVQVSSGSTAVFFGALSGNGCVGGGQVFLEGDTRPGFSAGLMTFGGDVTFGALSQTDIELGGLAAGSGYDQINVAGQANLDGTLAVSPIAGFLPLPGDAFDILTCGSRSGQFAAATGLDHVGGHAGLELRLAYHAAGATLTAWAMDGDANLDARVDVFDLAILGNNYNMGTGKDWLDGDYTGDGLVDVFDLAVLGNNYGYAGAGQPIPEPATILIVTAAGLPMLLKRRRNA